LALRLRQPEEKVPVHSPDFDAAECINLVTLRRSGEEVATPVWFVLCNGLAWLRTAQHFGKVKRIRNDPRVRYAACDWHGKVQGDWLRGTAELVAADDPRAALIDRLLDDKYGERRAEMSRLMVEQSMQPVYVVITPRA
jgi:uncharacterized protein